MPRYAIPVLLLMIAAGISAWMLRTTPDQVIEPVKVAWEGAFLDFTSLAHVNRAFTDALARQPGIEVARVGSKRINLQNRKFPELTAIVHTLTKKPPEGTEVTIRHAWPPKWEKPAEGKWILVQPWEYGMLPADWIRRLESVDEIWAYTNYVRQVYIDSGVPSEKVYVVPMGINPQIFHSAVAPRSLPTDKKFKILFVGGTIYRKGFDILLETYRTTFSASDDVCLVIKDFGSKGVYANQTMRDRIFELQKDPEAPAILYLDEEMKSNELSSLYKACDLLVAPYRGEGFALPVLEAMACGVPVLVSQGGSTDDFVNERCGWFIPCTRHYFGNKLGDYTLVGEGWELDPDRESISQRMRYAAEHPDEIREKGKAAARHAKENWTWDHGAALAARRIKALNEKKHD